MIRGKLKNIIFPFLPAKAKIFIERAYFGYYLREERYLFRQLCVKDKVSLDIGANKGDVALFLEQYSKKVICFEPNGFLCEELKKRLDSLNVDVYELALSDSKESKELFIPLISGHYLDSRATLIAFNEESLNRSFVKKVKIQTDRLDNLNIENIGFIKIDVEGWEYEVLVGSKETIKVNKPNIYIEIEEVHLLKRGMSVRNVIDYLIELGYAGYYWSKGTYYTIDTFDLKSMQNIENQSTDLYINNFIFIHSSKRGEMILKN